MRFSFALIAEIVAGQHLFHSCTTVIVTLWWLNEEVRVTAWIL